MQKINFNKVLTAVALCAPVTGFSADWQSSAHYGFALEQQSSTGFTHTGGTVMFFDFTRKLSDGIYLGLRTMGSGGEQSDSKFYRLDAGPLVSVNIGSKWSAQVGVGFFRESGETSDGTSEYKSQGRSLLLGWERHMELRKNLQLAWGGFWQRHWGAFDSSAAAAGTPTNSRFSNISANNGDSRGIEIALRTFM